MPFQAGSCVSMERIQSLPVYFQAVDNQRFGVGALVQHANTESKITRLCLEINIVLLFLLTVLVSGSRERQWGKIRGQKGLSADICCHVLSVGGLWILWWRMSNTGGFWGWSFSFYLDFITKFQSRQKGQENRKQKCLWGRSWEAFMYKARLLWESSSLPFYTTADAWKAVAWTLFTCL